jgi:effector-binding domain-containing protein
MPYRIDTKEVKPQPVVSARVNCRVGEVGPLLKQSLLQVHAHLEKHGARPSGPPFTRYHGYTGTQVDLEVGFPVSAPVPAGEGINAGELPGGTVAFTVHVGPYQDLPKAHDAMDAWLREKGKVSRGDQWEYYWTVPDEWTDRSTFKTELLWPVK